MTLRGLVHLEGRRQRIQRELDGQPSTTRVTSGPWLLPDTRLTWFQHGITLSAYSATLSVKSKSGASQKVGFEYSTGTARSIYYLCGNNDYPAYALRIHAGH